jgi:hypothetical protein
MFFESDTDWLFVWATFSSSYGRFIPILYPAPPAWQSPDLTSGFLSLLWITVAVWSCVILYRRRDDTFVRDIGLLLILALVQLIVPIALFAPLQRWPFRYYIWALPIPAPSLLAMNLMVINKTATEK